MSEATEVGEVVEIEEAVKMDEVVEVGVGEAQERKNEN